MKREDSERLFDLLQTRDIPGTPEQLQLLFVRLGELAKMNGREWVGRHRESLLRQWAVAVGRKDPPRS